MEVYVQLCILAITTATSGRPINQERMSHFKSLKISGRGWSQAIIQSQSALVQLLYSLARWLWSFDERKRPAALEHCRHLEQLHYWEDNGITPAPMHSLFLSLSPSLSLSLQSLRDCFSIKVQAHCSFVVVSIGACINPIKAGWFLWILVSLMSSTDIIALFQHLASCLSRRHFKDADTKDFPKDNFLLLR